MRFVLSALFLLFSLSIEASDWKSINGTWFHKKDPTIQDDMDIYMTIQTKSQVEIPADFREYLSNKTVLTQGDLSFQAAGLDMGPFPFIVFEAYGKIFKAYFYSISGFANYEYEMYQFLPSWTENSLDQVIIRDDVACSRSDSCDIDFIFNRVKTVGN